MANVDFFELLNRIEQLRRGGDYNGMEIACAELETLAPPPQLGARVTYEKAMAAKEQGKFTEALHWSHLSASQAQVGGDHIGAWYADAILGAEILPKLGETPAAIIALRQALVATAVFAKDVTAADRGRFDNLVMNLNLWFIDLGISDQVITVADVELCLKALRENPVYQKKRAGDPTLFQAILDKAAKYIDRNQK